MKQKPEKKITEAQRMENRHKTSRVIQGIQQYHKVEGQDECYQSHDGNASVQIFRYQDEIEWLVFVRGTKLFSHFPTKEKAIEAAEQKLLEKV